MSLHLGDVSVILGLPTRAGGHCLTSLAGVAPAALVGTWGLCAERVYGWSPVLRPAARCC
jgi:hypothetical protein